MGEEVTLSLRGNEIVEGYAAHINLKSGLFILSKDKDIRRILEITLENTYFIASSSFSISNLEFYLESLKKSFIYQDKGKLSLNNVYITCSNYLVENLIKVTNKATLSLNGVSFDTIESTDIRYGLCFYVDSTNPFITDYGTYSDLSFSYCRFRDIENKSYSASFCCFRISHESEIMNIVNVLENSVLEGSVVKNGAYVCLEIGNEI